MTLLRDFWAFLRDLPDLTARWCDRKVMEAHRPEPMPTEDLAGWPGGVMPACLRCNVVWPCDRYAHVSDRIDARGDRP